MTTVCDRCGKEYAAASPECPYCPSRPARYAMFAGIIALISVFALASAVMPAGERQYGSRGAFFNFDNTIIARTGMLGRAVQLTIAVMGFACAGALWLWKRWSPEAFAGWSILGLLWSGFATGSVTPSGMITPIVAVGIAYWYLRAGKQERLLEI